MRRAVPILLALFLVACGSGSNLSSPNPNPPPPPPPPPPAPVPNALIIEAGNNQEAAPGEAVTTIPAVRVMDQNNQPMAGIVVRFAVEAGGGTVQGESATTGTDGTARPAAWLLGPLPGQNRLQATSGTLSPVGFTATGQYLIATTLLNGTIGLPAGTLVAPGTLRMQTGLTDVPVGADGSFQGVVEPGITTLASARAPNGNTILFGWIDPQRTTLSVRSTAEVLTWFDVNGYLQPLRDARRIVREYLAGADLHELEAALRAVLAGDPATITLATPTVIEARNAVVQRLRAAAGQLDVGTPANVIVEPGGTEKSGAVVDQQGLLGVITTNNWRRRVVSFVDRVPYIPKGGTESISSVHRGPGVKLGAVAAVTSVIGTGIDIMFGNLPYTPVISSPVQVTRFPADARSTLYQVTVVGPGHRGSTVPLTQEQEDAGLLAGLETLVMEFVLPMLDQILSADNLARDPPRPACSAERATPARPGGAAAPPLPRQPGPGPARYVRRWLATTPLPVPSPAPGLRSTKRCRSSPSCSRPPRRHRPSRRRGCAGANLASRYPIASGRARTTEE